MQEQEEKDRAARAERLMAELDNSFKQGVNGFPGFEDLNLKIDADGDKKVKQFGVGEIENVDDMQFGGTDGFDDMWDNDFKLDDDKLGAGGLGGLGLLHRGQFGRDTI